MSSSEGNYVQIRPTDNASNAPELFAQHLSQAPEGHRFHGCTLWKLERKNEIHYIIFNDEPSKATKEGREILLEKMPEFAEAENYFTAGRSTREYNHRLRDWLDLSK